MYIEVVDPILKSGTVVYNIKGSDSEGSYDVVRRYNDFHHCRQIMISRWPGCYIPPIPSKQAIGNKEHKFIEDRKRFLQYFCENVSKLKHLYYSEEF